MNMRFLKRLAKAPLRDSSNVWAYKVYYTAADFEMEPSSPPSPIPSNEDGNIRVEEES